MERIGNGQNGKPEKWKWVEWKKEWNMGRMGNGKNGKNEVG